MVFEKAWEIVDDLAGIDCGLCGVPRCADLARRLFRGNYTTENICRILTEDKWKTDVIMAKLQWLDGFFMDEENVPLPSLEELKSLLHGKLL